MKPLGVQLFDSIPIATPTEAIYKRLGYKEGDTQLTGQQQDDLAKCIDEAVELIELKALAARIGIAEIMPDGIVLAGGIEFKSKNLSSWMIGCNEMLIMASTAGSKIMQAIKESSSKDGLSQAVVYDAVGSEMADSVFDWLITYYNRELRREEKCLDAKRYSAGYGDFKLENQKVIYDLLNLKQIGVDITEKCILVPEKSVTAMVGVKEVK